MDTVDLDDLAEQDPASSEEARPRRFQFGLVDVAFLFALHAAIVNGTVEIYRVGGTDSDPRSLNRVEWVGGSWPPELPNAPVVVEIGSGMRFTAFCFRRFLAWLIGGVLAILISYFGTALLLTTASRPVRRAGPRLAASVACLMFAAALSAITYDHRSAWFETDGHWIDATVRTASWAMGPPIAVIGTILVMEIMSYLRGLRRRRVARKFAKFT